MKITQADLRKLSDDQLRKFQNACMRERARRKTVARNNQVWMSGPGLEVVLEASIDFAKKQKEEEK